MKIKEGDALKLHIPLNSLRDVKLGFRNDNNNMEYLILPDLCVAVGTKKDQKHKQISQGSPSILGLDILGLDFFEEQKLLLHIDPLKKDIFFERS